MGPAPVELLSDNRQPRYHAVIICQPPSLSIEVSQIIGVDDWALKKRGRYGTLLIDLQWHQVTAVLLQQASLVISAWLKHHPRVEWPLVSAQPSTLTLRSREHLGGTNGRPPALELVLDTLPWLFFEGLRPAFSISFFAIFDIDSR
jgi:hypothetical protein